MLKNLSLKIFITLYLNYSSSKFIKDKLEKLQKKAIQIMSFSDLQEASSPLFKIKDTQWSLLRRISHKTDTSLRRTFWHTPAEHRSSLYWNTSIRQTSVTQLLHKKGTFFYPNEILILKTDTSNLTLRWRMWLLHW